MAESAVTAVLSKFGELAMSEARMLLQVGDDMLLLRDRLEWLQAFIRDADRKRRAGTDGLTCVWVRQTRDVAFEAEDALDEFFHQANLRRRGYQGWKRRGKYLTGFPTKIIVRHRMNARVSRIKSTLGHISENQKEYKIEHTPSITLTSSTTAIAAWRGDLENAEGFEGHVVDLKEMLLCNYHTQQMFISILGESGAGKNTLVNIICNNLQVREDICSFQVILRYDMPPESSMEDLLADVYKRLVACKKEENAECHHEEKGIDIADKLRSILSKKKYLLILGGITSNTMLNCVRASLPDDNNGSRVVLVLDTENEEVAWHANAMNAEGANKIHQLNRLDADKSGELFRWRVYRKKKSGNEETMSKYDKIVYDITGGYPMAIVVLAGLLRFKEKPAQWDAVLKQLRPGTEEAEGSQGNRVTEDASSKEMSSTIQANLCRRTAMDMIFWASFEDLPIHLKSCFLYFAAYPKNMSHSVDELLQMWMGEGFIKPQKGKTMEDVGQNYLKELVLRCLVEIVEMKHCGRIKVIRVHNRVLGFLQSEAREAGFVEVHDIHDVLVPPSVRRLSVQSDSGRYTTFTHKFPKLRSFICRVKCQVEGEGQSNDIAGMKKKKKHWHDLKFLRRSKFLRVISVQGLRLQGLPDEIGDMINLRYLRVDCRHLRKIPSSIKRLLNLQTLDIRNTQVEDIDKRFWKIKALQHVLADNLTLPVSIEEELDDLQTLHGVKPAKEAQWDQTNCPLQKMTKLRSLELHGFQHGKHGDALEAALGKMQLLRHFNLQGDMIPSCVFMAPSLRYLQTIVFDGTVKWPEDGWEVCKVRPNLIQLTVKNNNDVPQHIRKELAKIPKLF